MTPPARLQTAIELLDAVIVAARTGGAPADRLIAEGLRQRRYAGSKDRRAVRELVYRAIRACGPVPPSGRAAMLRLAEDDPGIAVGFDGSAYGPAPIQADEPVAHGGIAPDWLMEALAASGVEGEEAAALLGRASLDVRVNRLKADRDTLVLPEAGEKLAAPDGLRFPFGTPVERWDAFRDGLIEVQDGGSQLACRSVAAKSGEVVIDLCAGAGGKTLALAAAMGNQGTLIAADINRARLSQLAPRAERAGARIAETLLLDPGREAEALAPWQGRADAVLVDAPCSGTGTWRRNPESRWRITPAELERVTALQSRLLALAATLTKPAGPDRPGGRIIYVVCSLLRLEGAERVDHFLGQNAGWGAVPGEPGAGRLDGPGIRLSPCHDDTDGFFFATISRL